MASGSSTPCEQALGIPGDCETSGKVLIDIGNYNHAVDQPIVREARLWNR